jgi:hypothetical protein
MSQVSCKELYMRNAFYKSTALSFLGLAGIACLGMAQPAMAQSANDNCQLSIVNAVTMAQGNCGTVYNGDDFCTTGILQLRLYSNAINSGSAPYIVLAVRTWKNYWFNTTNSSGNPDQQTEVHSYIPPYLAAVRMIQSDEQQQVAKTGCSAGSFSGAYAYCNGAANNGCEGSGSGGIVP